MATILKIEKSRHLVVIMNGPLKRTGRPPSWIFKIKNYNGCALERPILHHCAKFRGDRSYRCNLQRFRNFSRFQMKCRNLLDGHA